MPLADLSNWRTRPYSPTAFRDVGALIPTVPIPNDPARERPLPRAPVALDGLAIETGRGTPTGLAEFLETTCTDGLVVLHDGRTVFEWYADGMDASTPHILMSASKSIVGLLAGVLQERGEIDVGATVESLLPEIGAAWRGATLRQLLDMRTGVLFDDAGAAVYRSATGWDTPGSADEAADLRSFFERYDGTPRPHGGAFSYVSANTDLFGLAIERATGRRFADLLAEHLWQPLVASRPASVTVDARGAARCTGGISATVGDFARIGQLLVDDGRVADATVVPPGWVADIATAGDRHAWNEGEFAPLFPGLPMRYRSGWYSIDAAPQTLFALGIHGQHLLVDRTNRLVVAKAASHAEPTDPATTRLTLRAFGAIRKMLVGATGG